MIRIGTRDSKLAVWQAEQVQQLLAGHGHEATLVFIKSEGDIDLTTPLYAMGVQGVFTRSLDIALLNNKIDIAVHSMKDVPTQLPQGIVQAAVLERGPVNDLLVFKNEETAAYYHAIEAGAAPKDSSPFVVATSSIRRKAQWLNRFPGHAVENLRGNVITRLQKLQAENWHAAIFAQAGLERIGVRPALSEVLDWMLPAPAQGAIMVVCRQGDDTSFDACKKIDHHATAACATMERDFLKTLMGGCSTPISALATIDDTVIKFDGSILSTDGKDKAIVSDTYPLANWTEVGQTAAHLLLQNGGDRIASAIRNGS